MILGMYSGALFLLLYSILGIFLFLWPILIWSHLREQTKYLQEIRDLIRSRGLS